jgi:epsin
VAAKELTTLILDEERLRVERTDRRSWKSRVHGLDEQGPPPGESPQRRRRRYSSDDDMEYKLAIEASKAQEEEDRRKRASRQGGDTEDDDLAKAIKLSKEEEERRRRELEEGTRTSLFDDDLIQVAEPTGFNQGYQQGSAVDFFANPIGQTPTGYGPGYPGFMPQQTGFQNGFGQGYDPYGQQGFAQQPTGWQQQQQPQPEPVMPMPTGSNNPWATANAGMMKPAPTGSNNPFAAAAGRPAAFKATSLGSLPEQKTLSSFGGPIPQTSFTPPPQPTQQPAQQIQPAVQQPPRELSEHEAKLNALLAGGDGLDTFGNTGQLRIPAQHTAPGTFVNSAGANLGRLTAEATGSNPFLRSQFTGMPTVSYQQMPAATGPAGMNGGNPFGRQQPQQQQSNQGDLIQF